MPKKKLPSLTEDGERLKRYLDNVPFCKYNDIFNEIVALCGICRPTIYRWTSGRSKIPYLAKKAINDYAGKEVFPLESDKTLN